MSVSMNTAPSKIAELVPSASASSTQLRAWVASGEGQQLWEAAGIMISLEGLCHALDQANANTYGLLVSPEATIILSVIQPATFARLEPRYHHSAETGLCFWWNGQTLMHIKDSKAFLALVRTLPPLSARTWFTRRVADHGPIMAMMVNKVVYLIRCQEHCACSPHHDEIPQYHTKEDHPHQVWYCGIVVYGVYC